MYLLSLQLLMGHTVPITVQFVIVLYLYIFLLDLYFLAILLCFFIYRLIVLRLCNKFLNLLCMDTTIIKEYHLFGLIWQSGKRNLLNIRLSFIHIRQDIAQLSPSVCL